MRPLDGSSRRSPRSEIGDVVITLGRRMQNLGFVLQAPDGFSLRRLGLSARTVQTLRQTMLSSAEPPRTILDVGAHRGEFMTFAAAAFPEATIHCFEPVRESFAELAKRAQQVGPRVQCHETALGPESREVEINVNPFTAASSTFYASPLHGQAFPETAGRTIVERVPCMQLDVWAEGYELEHPILFKLDVQGAELNVFEGGSRILGESSAILVELSFDELYIGAPLAEDVMRFLGGRGFRLVEFLSDLRDPDSERLLQADAIFVASSATHG